MSLFWGIIGINYFKVTNIWHACFLILLKYMKTQTLRRFRMIKKIWRRAVLQAHATWQIHKVKIQISIVINKIYKTTIQPQFLNSVQALHQTTAVPSSIGSREVQERSSRHNKNRSKTIRINEKYNCWNIPYNTLL